ncbi:MAG TPA: glycoside hydrolase family 2 TIM barrel-domain containing protein, partial [Hypericibacter adhaerens]|uniref:glycoside hydrolase family 2 TIM barrel-domain containing protein n=1 Tax=Hypericibacter adhaerens TaxID=2602016 RepID=UPI002C7F6183
MRARYAGLDPAQTYEIEATFGCERGQARVMAIRAGDVELAPAVELKRGGATVVRLAVPASAIASGVLEVSVARRSGPDALVSELRLYGSKPVPPLLTVVGDSRGGLFGSVSDAEYNGIPSADVTVRWDRGELRTVTDARGLFRVPLRESLPHGQHCDLTITAVAGGPAATQRISTRALAQGLRELPEKGARLDLSGEWRFVPGRAEGPDAPQRRKAAVTRVPGHVAFDGLIPDAGVATLFRTIALPADWAGDAVFARFDGAYGRAEIFVNGRHAGTHAAGATSFDVEISPFLGEGENDLAVVLTEYTAHSVLDYMSWYAHTSLLGLWREALLFHVPKVHLGPTDLRLDWDAADRSGSAEIATEIVNLGTQAQSYRLELSLTDQDRLVHRSVLTGEVKGEASQHRQVSLRVPDAEPWSAEIPRLYDLEFSLMIAGGAGASYRRRLGFRRVEVRGNQLLVNGAPIRLTGVNRHDARMRSGRSMRFEDLRHDVLALRQANVNVIRTAHYPADPRLLELCDELGMYVQDQMPICFAAGFDDHHWTRTNDAANLVPILLEVTAETVGRDQGHASVIIWDLANETQWAWGFDAQLELVRRMDPGRPSLFSFDLNQLGDVNPLPHMPREKRPDIRTYHYPGWDRSWQEDIDWLRSYDQPCVLDECSPPFQDNARAPLHAELLSIDPGMRDYWVTGAKPFMARVMRDRGCIGGMIWSAVDDQWVLPLDESIGSGNWAHLTRLDYYRVRDVHPPQDGVVFRGEGEWGLLDGWGRHRPELWHVHKLYSPVEIAAARFESEGRRLVLSILNRHAHRRLESLEVRLRGATSGGSSCARIEAAAGATGTLVADVSSQAAMVELEFRHPEGWLVDAFSWPVPGRASDVRAAVRAKSHPAEVALTAGGELAASGSETWLKSWPRLHVLDANRPLDRLPLPQVDCLRAKARPDGIVTVPLAGEGWDGWLSAGAAGAETVFSYECIYQGPESFDAHEIGLAFDAPAGLPDLWWHRIADWTAYPAGHIGRPRGYARSAPAAANPLHPAERWEDDTTEAGTNDYRSAKRAILAAGVTDGAASV